MTAVDARLVHEWVSDDGFCETQGRLLIIGGSRQTPGAARLAAEGALRAGAETVQVLTVRSTATALAVAVPELLVAGADENPDGELAASAFGLARELAEQADVVLVGPGFMSPQAAVDLCRPLLPRLEARIVVDALALAYLAAEPTYRFADGQAVLTPNAGEVALALDVDPEELEREKDGGALRLARRANAVVSSGGVTSWVASPDGRTWTDSAGHGGLGASGSGDCKSGIVAATFTRTTNPQKAAVWGGHVHALAGERVAERVGGVGYLAREVVAAVPGVMTALMSSSADHE